jgi:2-dehydro-3-deoxyphosphogluconate aldolase/(4S)-4-hydroxy-2-oxoglutarate aldolase
VNGIDAILRQAPVIPVLVIDDPADARPIAEALVDGGLPVLEVTLRTPAALEAIRDMADVPGAIVGAGSVVRDAQVEAAAAAGSRFLVSPGLSEGVAAAALAREIPWLPGVVSASDIMRGLALGLDCFKFFPAVPAGGLSLLASLSAPFEGVRFCPTGGIREETAAEWLRHPAVLAVGGSWLVPPGRPDIAAIRESARRAARLRKG